LTLVPSAQASARVWTKDQFGSIIQSQKHLRTLRIAVTDLTANYKNLPVLSSLTTLQFIKRNLTQDSYPPQQLTADGYARVASLIPALTKIGGSAGQCTLSFWISTLPKMGRTISEVELTGAEPMHSSVFRELISVIGGACPDLRSLAIKDIAFTDAASVVDLTGVLQPLLGCLSIRYLEMCGDRNAKWDLSFAITDAGIKTMASVWHDLEEFYLYVRRDDSTDDIIRPQTPTLTLDAIDMLCRLCPRLRAVTMTVDATIRPISLESRGNGFGFAKSTLQALDLAGSIISNPFDVAMWLGDICTADGVGTSHDVESEIGTLWLQAMEYLRGMQDIRKAEKESAAETIRCLEYKIATLESAGRGQ
jgi:hypothetical protein